MQKIAAVLFCLALAPNSVLASGKLIEIVAKQKSSPDQGLLEETRQLSKDVKKFEEAVLGIKPSDALKYIGGEEKPKASMLWVWAQKRGVISPDPAFTLQIEFNETKEKIPIQYVLLDIPDQHVYYFRQSNEFSETSVITPSFARESLARKVEVIFHEDLHSNIKINGRLTEALPTALGYLCANFYLEAQTFLHVGNPKKRKVFSDSLRELRININKMRQISWELNFLESSLNQLAKNVAVGGTDYVNGARSLFAKCPNYSKWSGYKDDKIYFEAELGHDLAYWKYFDRIIALSETIGDLKVLIQDLKSVPVDPALLDGYLNDLEGKYTHRSP